MRRVAYSSLLLAGAFLGQRCDNEEAPAPVDCTVNPVEVTVVSVTNSNCGALDGAIEVSASGGSGPYTFSLDGGDAKASGVFNDLAAGVYEVTAIDKNKCEATIEASVMNEDGLNISFETDPSGCGQSGGSLTVTPIDGAAPYQFKLGGGAFGSSGTFASLARGDYQLTVRDAEGCEVNQEISITSGVSYSAAIAPIIQSNCAVSGCHNGSQFPDFRLFKNIHDNAGKIKTLTGNGTMPQNGSLTQQQIDLIACWVDDGAPQN